MCGISVIVDRAGAESLQHLIERMGRIVKHRGPDFSASSIYGSVALGHTRLSIIDLTDGGNQPMSYGRHHLTYNGEIYNYRELKTELLAAGRPFSTQCDTEVLLVALEHWGLGALERLKGMFAFAYLDEDAGALFLVRDRFGKKPLVYARDGLRFLAGSEVKQIVDVLSTTPRVHRDSALRYLSRSELNGMPETFIEGVFEVPPGHFLRYDVKTGDIQLTRWYDLSSKIVRTSDRYETARNRVRELLEASIRRRHIADVPVGICLSGGIDSSAIAALSATLFPQKTLQTISSYAEGAGFDERKFSRAVVERFGLKPIEIRPDTAKIWDPDFLAGLCYVQDQPLGSGSQYNEYCVFEAARQAGLIVMLDGQGADEYFGGYGEFWFSAQLELLRRGQFKAFLDGVAARGQAQGRSSSVVLRQFLLSLASRRRKASRQSDKWQRFQPPATPPRWDGAQPFDQLSLEEMLTSSIPFQVHSEDRNAMRWSVESRLPFLDHDLVEYVMGLPSDFKVRRGVQKAILRDAVPELPAIVAQRKDKVGFASPDAAACFDHAPNVRQTLQSALGRLSPLIVQDVIVSAFDRMTEKRAGYDGLFFRIVSFDAWMRAFNATI